MREDAIMLSSVLKRKKRTQTLAQAEVTIKSSSCKEEKKAGEDPFHKEVPTVLHTLDLPRTDFKTFKASILEVLVVTETVTLPGFLVFLSFSS